MGTDEIYINKIQYIPNTAPYQNQTYYNNYIFGEVPENISFYHGFIVT